MVFKSSISDTDVCTRPATKADGENYHEFILVYVEYLPAISQYSVSVITEVAEKFKLKKDKIELPEIYLRGLLARKKLNDNQVSIMGSVDYVKSVVKNLEERLKKQGMKLPDRATTPTSSDYIPELDTTAELDANDITMFQELIGELIWAKEIGRVDILHDVLVLSEFQGSPREGNLHQVFHIFASMEKNPKLTIHFDPRFPNIDTTSFSVSLAEELRKQHQDAMEESPKDIPEPIGN